MVALAAGEDRGQLAQMHRAMCLQEPQWAELCAFCAQRISCLAGLSKGLTAKSQPAAMPLLEAAAGAVATVACTLPRHQLLRGKVLIFLHRMAFVLGARVLPYDEQVLRAMLSIPELQAAEAEAVQVLNQMLAEFDGACAQWTPSCWGCSSARCWLRWRPLRPLSRRWCWRSRTCRRSAWACRGSSSSCGTWSCTAARLPSAAEPTCLCCRTCCATPCCRECWAGRGEAAGRALEDSRRRRPSPARRVHQRADAGHSAPAQARHRHPRRAGIGMAAPCAPPAGAVRATTALAAGRRADPGQR
ncbi:hypothetical protein B484DRAFT_441594 [Ochromonadaceae sp. CCMP2298]|nr:hypothetical protein B484DRAFT_441594 [Ochromonadaceae sp. CCMP2298]